MPAHSRHRCNGDDPRHEPARADRSLPERADRRRASLTEGAMLKAEARLKMACGASESETRTLDLGHCTRLGATATKERRQSNWVQAGGFAPAHPHGATVHRNSKRLGRDRWLPPQPPYLEQLSPTASLQTTTLPARRRNEQAARACSSPFRCPCAAVRRTLANFYALRTFLQSHDKHPQAAGEWSLQTSRLARPAWTKIGPVHLSTESPCGNHPGSTTTQATLAKCMGRYAIACLPMRQCKQLSRITLPWRELIYPNQRNEPDR